MVAYGVSERPSAGKGGTAHFALDIGVGAVAGLGAAAFCGVTAGLGCLLVAGATRYGRVVNSAPGLRSCF